ncbi:unnamed protein product [Didymodactylos carnosus]|uniref:SH3 domain-containing protein n=1 Tax=Didymodactylos carnosus TaxID=1234261 RepID=A0A8S2GXB2_9BILA|nr:unnamed protein product [Didymodactylos carnosus]CAF3567969.1 unnamed protein product [Didymodactylos carnosus]
MDKNHYSQTRTTANESIDELVQIVQSHIYNTNHPTLDFVTASSPLFRHPNLQSDVTQYTSLMETSAAKQQQHGDEQRNDFIENNSKTNDLSTQHHYQNIQQILDQSFSPSPTIASYDVDAIVDANIINPSHKEIFNSKHDVFEQKAKNDNFLTTTYDTPPQVIASPIVKTNLTTTTYTDRQSTSSHKLPSVDKVLEQPVKLQKNVEAKRYKTKDGEIVNSIEPLAVIEGTEEYKIHIDEKENQLKRTSEPHKSTIIKIGHATDLDQAAAASRKSSRKLNDDHQAIQDLTKAIQDRQRSKDEIVSTTTTTPIISSTAETSKEHLIRLPSKDDNTSIERKLSISNALPATSILNDKTNFPTFGNEYIVIDALINNPLTIVDQQREKTNFFNNRIREIETNLRNPDYIASLKQSQSNVSISKKTKAKPKKEPKKKQEKVDKKKSSKKPKETPVEEFDAVQHMTVTPVRAPVTLKKTYQSLPEHTPSSSTQPNVNLSSLPLTTTPSSMSDDGHVTTISATLISSPPPTAIDLPVTVGVDEKAPLLDPKEKKKLDKEKKQRHEEEKKRQKEAEKAEKNKKKLADKQKKSKKLATEDRKDSRSIDAAVSHPISSRSSDSYIIKQVSTTDQSVGGMLVQPTEKRDGEAVDFLIKIVQEMFLHGAAVLTASSSSSPTTKPPSHTAVPELVPQHHQLSRASAQTEDYRYIDERGVLVRDYEYKPLLYNEQGRADTQYIRYTDNQEPSLGAYGGLTTEIIRQKPFLSHIDDDDQYIRPIDELGQHTKQFSPRDVSEETSLHEIVRKQPPTTDYTQFVDEQGRSLRHHEPSYSYEYSARADGSTYQNEKTKTTISTPTPHQVDNRTDQRRIINDYVDDRGRKFIPKVEEKRWEGDKIVPTTIKREDIELLDKRIPQLSEQQNISMPIKRNSISRPERMQEYTQQNNNIELAWLPLNYAEQMPIGYETDSTISERSFAPPHISAVPSSRQTYTRTYYQPTTCIESRYMDPYYRRLYLMKPVDYYGSYYTRPPYTVHRSGPLYHGRSILPEYGTSTRNYIEVFRDGDTKPSEVYSLPLLSSLMNEPPLPSSVNNDHHSRYDQHHGKKYSTAQRFHTGRGGDHYCSSTLPSSSATTNNLRYTSLPSSRYKNRYMPIHYTDYNKRYVPSYFPSYPVEQRYSLGRCSCNDREGGFITPLYTPTYKQHQRYPVENNHTENYLRQSKSATFDYRPLRSKLQREHKITPSLLVDEKWDTQPQQYEQEISHYRSPNNNSNKYYTTDKPLTHKTETYKTVNPYRRSTDDENIHYRSQQQHSTELAQNRDHNVRWQVGQPRNDIDPKITDDHIWKSNQDIDIGIKSKQTTPKLVNGQTDAAKNFRILDNSQNSSYESSRTLTNRASSYIQKALALYTFHAQSNRELPFKKGDIISVTRRINQDWLEGEHNGNFGIFPFNHVELYPYSEDNNTIKANSQINNLDGEAIVKHDFIPQNTFELQLRKGERVILLKRLDENWYEGRLNNVEGIFPSSYVETLKEPINRSEGQTRTSNKPHKINEKTEKSIPQHTNDSKPSRNASKQQQQQRRTMIQQPSIEKIHLPSAQNTFKKCQVLYDYIPQHPDELEIHVGDIVNIVEMCNDGWYVGTIDSNGKTLQFGTFPGNYVKPIK